MAREFGLSCLVSYVGRSAPGRWRADIGGDEGREGGQGRGGADAELRGG